MIFSNIPRIYFIYYRFKHYGGWRGEAASPKKAPGKRPKADEGAYRRPLEADLEERPAATLLQRRECLEQVRGIRASESTVSRLLRRLGWTLKEVGGCQLAGRMI
jgi:transposase